MMDFVIITASILVAMLVWSVIAMGICCNKTVLKWYMKKVTKMTEEVMNESFGIMDSKDGEA